MFLHTMLHHVHCQILEILSKLFQACILKFTTLMINQDFPWTGGVIQT